MLPSSAVLALVYLQIVNADSRPLSGEESSGAPPAEVQTYHGTDIDHLLPLLGSRVSLEGTAVRIAENKAGSTWIVNFSNRPDQGVALTIPDRLGDRSVRQRLRAVLGQHIQVTGTLLNHQGRMQMAVDSPDELHTIR